MVAMHVDLKVFSVILSLGVTILTGSAAAQQTESISLKSGETVELGNLFWVVNCRSILKGPPVAEVLEGLPEISVTVREQKVIPRKLNCAKEVSGGMLILIAAKDVKARIQGKLTIRIKYPTVDGERQHSREINVTLFP
ncbi:hypothetical protein RZS28_15535 [Methylocapsa polymorpha]|uniref:Uncharacterized protein n=1 Tax=Methylocapsa polymorpha TaxID=3080828 RepID=A0ABZ0HQM5_9HYPH|nr:hypothetical protein RZS28_15535 [Methylocapsa sp. RX1]